VTRMDKIVRTRGIPGLVNGAMVNKREAARHTGMTEVGEECTVAAWSGRQDE